MNVLFAVQAVATVFSEGSSAGGRREKAILHRTVIGLNGRAYRKYLGKMVLVYW